MLPPACTVTNTNVVESQASVLSDSGASVGMVYATTSTDSTGIGVHSLMPGVYPQRPRGMQNDGWKVIAGREFPRMCCGNTRGSQTVDAGSWSGRAATFAGSLSGGLA